MQGKYYFYNDKSVILTNDSLLYEVSRKNRKSKFHRELVTFSLGNNNKAVDVKIEADYQREMLKIYAL